MTGPDGSAPPPAPTPLSAATPAPAPAVVTVTANPALDQTVWVPGFAAGEVNRVEREETTAGGKGVNVAAFLAAFGVPVAASGFLGRANAGVFEDFLASRGIGASFVPVAGATRTGIKIVDDKAGTTTDVNFPGFAVTGAELDALDRDIRRLAAPGRWVVLAGSLPRDAPTGTYRRLADAAHAAGASVALDTSGAALGEALAAGPELVKPNRAELEELVGRPLPNRAALVAAARELAASGIGTVVVSLGAEGALFVRDGEAVFATPPPVPVASTVGAGDAMVAGTLLGTLRKLPLPRVASLATACSAVAIGRVGPHLDPAAVEETAGAVVLEDLGPSAGGTR
jgi:1-phosphofructokinase